MIWTCAAHRIAWALPLLGAVCLAHGETRYWNGNLSTAWDTTTANWKWPNGSANASFATGDTAVFDASKETSATVVIDAGGVSPAETFVQDYHNAFTLTGGDIAGPGGLTIRQQGRLYLTNHTASLSFAGNVVIDGNQTALYWKPTASGTLAIGQGEIVLQGAAPEVTNPQEFYFQPTGPSALGNPAIRLTGRVELFGNAYADWSATTLVLDGILDLNWANGVWQDNRSFNGLIVSLAGDRTLEIGNHYNTANTAHFNGTVSGPSAVLTIHANKGFSNGIAVIDGPGNWDILGLTKTGVYNLKVTAPNVFGDVLRIAQGKIDCGGLTHDVKDLWLGGVQMTVPGTYGPAGSGADVIADAWFAGTGKVRLLALPTVSLTVIDGRLHEETAGDSAVIRFSRDTVTAALTVGYTLGGTASFADVNEALPGTTVIPDGLSHVDLVLTAVNDGAFEDVFERLTFSLTTSADYRRSATDFSGEVRLTDGDLPSGNAMTFAAEPMTAGISGFRAAWDSPAPGALSFDAIHRSLLVRFPGCAVKIAQMIRAGHAVEAVELVLPFDRADTLPVGYSYSNGHGEVGRWEGEAPSWHAVGVGLLRPWTADAAIGPTYNAYINGAGYWDAFGARATGADCGPTPFAPTEVSAYCPTGRLDLTTMLADPAYGATLADRLLNLEESGAHLRKWETWDAHYAYRDGYQFGIETGGHALHIGMPRLTVAFTDTATPPDVSSLEAPVDVAHLALTLSDGAPTAVMPDAATFDTLRAAYGLRAQPWMTAWQTNRLDELMTAHDSAGGAAAATRYRIPDTLADYTAWCDELLATPIRRWLGHDTTRLALDYLQYADALPAPVSDHLRAYWEAYIQPDRATAEFVHPQAADAIAYDTWAYGDDWRGNTSFFREGYVFDLSTLNFNHTAVAGALLGSAVLGRLDSEAYTDGQRGLEGWYVNFWGWSDGSSQEELDHYYYAVTQFQQLALRQFAPSATDRMMADRAFLKSREICLSTYHPNLHRFIATSQRTTETQVFVGQDGLYDMLHTLSDAAGGVLRDLASSLPSSYYALGHDIQPGAIARLFATGAFGNPWLGRLVEKELPFTLQARHSSRGWLTTHLGEHYGLASQESEATATRPFMAQWRRTASGVPGMRDIGTLFAAFGLNTSLFMGGSGGIVPHRGGELAVLQHRNKAFIFSSPNPNFSGYTYTPPASVTNIQTALGFFTFETPTWTIYLNGTEITDRIAGGVTAAIGDRITIEDGTTFIAVIPLAANDLGRTTAVRISRGATEACTDSSAQATAELLIELFNCRSATPLDTAAVGWDAIKNSYAAFVVEFGDAAEYPGFADFHTHITNAATDVTWHADVQALEASYTSGSGTLQGRFIPALAGSPACVPFKRHNGDPVVDLPSWVQRDSDTSQIGYSPDSAGLTLSKGGATLELDGWRWGYLQVEPQTRTCAGHHIKSDLTAFRLTSPAGRVVRSAGKVTLASVEIQDSTGTVWIEWAAERVHHPDLADAFLLTGFPETPTVYLQGAPVTELPTRVVDGQTAYVVPIIIADALPRVSVAATDPAAAELGPDPARFTFSRDSTNGALTVRYSVSGSAHAADYAETLSGAILIDDGLSCATLTLTPVDDTRSEGDETIVINVSPDPAYWITSANAAATATLVDNDFDVIVSLTATDPDASEAGTDSGRFTLFRSVAAGDLTIRLAVGGTAVGGGTDYVENLGGSVTLTGTNLESVLCVTPVNDTSSEGLEAVTVTVVPDAAYDVGDASTAEVVIFDDEAVARSLDWTGVVNGDWDTATTNWLGGLAYADGDHALFDDTGKNRPMIAIRPGGVFPRTLVINHYNPNWVFSGGPLRGACMLDIRFGSKVTFTNYTGSLSFSGGTVATDGTLTWAPATSEPIRLGSGPVHVAKGGFRLTPSVPHTLNMELSLGAGPLTLAGNDHADWGGQPIPVNGAAVSLPGSSGTWNYDNLVLELLADSSLNLTASYNGGQSRFNGRIIGVGVLTINGTGGGGSTTARADIAGPGHWRHGGTTFNYSKNLYVSAPQVMGAAMRIESSSWPIILQNATDAQSVTNLWLDGVRMTTPGTYGGVASAARFLTARLAGAGMVTLVPDDTAVQLTATDTEADEQGPEVGRLTFTRNNAIGQLTVYFAISGTAVADDFTETPAGHITFADGDDSHTLTLTPVDDTAAEPAESFTVTLSPHATYAIGGTGGATVVIAASDLPPPPQTGTVLFIR